MGYSHIPQKYAAPINAFYEGVFNTWLNWHRPCLYATEVVSNKGKIKKVYRSQDTKTPLECLAQLSKAGLVKFKTGSKLNDLLDQAREKTDLQAAQEMQKPRLPCSLCSTSPNVSDKREGTHPFALACLAQIKRRHGGLRRPGRGLNTKKTQHKAKPLNLPFQPDQAQPTEAVTSV